ncbi:MAG: NAD-binding protein [SAR202 cluster bacterium]|jgi:trk system potassium uptake protein TrkA|nr:NAD-binding protein [SAR202 cluster bacterium]
MLQTDRTTVGDRKVTIMGCGGMAASIAITLSDQGYGIHILDLRIDSFNRLPPGKTQSGEIIPIVGDGTLQQNLLKAAIEDADVFMALSDSDTRNALAAQVASNIFRVPTVICRVEDPIMQKVYAGLGIVVLGATNLVAENAVKAASW